MKLMTNIAVIFILVAATWVVYGGIDFASVREVIAANAKMSP